MMLGNLSIGDMEKRLGIKFPEELILWMTKKYQQEASHILQCQWHCFDLPFTLVCGDIETATKIRNCLEPLSSEMLTQINIAWCN